MSNDRDPNPMPAVPIPAGSSVPSGDVLSSQAQLARDERNAALRALTGRLAHQLRNPLAAVRAACNGLRAEVEDSEQRDTLDLTLAEIDRMLGFVMATVRSIPEQAERPREVDVVGETRAIIDIVQAARPSGMRISLSANGTGARGLLPCNALRVAIYSVLDQLAAIIDVESIAVDISDSDHRLQLRFAIHGDVSEEPVLADGLLSSGGWGQAPGLLVAERFARDVGGRLQVAKGGGTGLAITLELPHVHA